MSNSDWWKAKCGDTTGLIPSNYGEGMLMNNFRKSNLKKLESFFNGKFFNGFLIKIYSVFFIMNFFRIFDYNFVSIYLNFQKFIF